MKWHHPNYKMMIDLSKVSYYYYNDTHPNDAFHELYLIIDGHDAKILSPRCQEIYKKLKEYTQECETNKQLLMENK